MRTASGWSLRLASTACWLFFSLGCVTYCCDMLLLRPRFFQFAAGLFTYRTYSCMFMMYVCVVPTFLLQWWCMMNKKEQPALVLSILVKRLPLWVTRPYKNMKAVLLLIFSILGGALFVQVYADNTAVSSDNSQKSLWYFGASAGAIHAAVFLSCGMDRVDYPVMHRKRSLRLKQSLPTILSLACVTSLCSWMCSVLAVIFVPFVDTPLIRHFIRCLVGTFLYCFLSSLAAIVSGIVLSERLYLQHFEHEHGHDHCSMLQTLGNRLKSQQDPIDDTITLQELSLRSDYFGIDLWESLFNDSMGEDHWQPISVRCLKTLDELCTSLGAFFTAQQALAAMQRPEWGIASGPMRVIKTAPSQEQLLAEHFINTRCTACVFSASIVTDVSILSRSHDKCGLLQMPPPGTPGFADAVKTLIYSYALLDKFLAERARSKNGFIQAHLYRFYVTVGKFVGVIDPGTSNKLPSQHAATAALHSCIAHCISRIRQEFGNSLPGSSSKSQWCPEVTVQSLDLNALEIAFCRG